MGRKMEHLKSYDVYELVPRTNGMRTLKLRWVLHRKFKIDLFERNKGILVARGNHRRPGIDYGESFSPVVHLESLCTILALVAVRDLDVIQFDITSAYLHGQLEGGGVSWSNQRVTSLPGREIRCGALRRAYTGS